MLTTEEGMQVPTSYAEAIALFGNPVGGSGALDTAWRTNNIVLVRPPEPWGPPSASLLSAGTVKALLYYQSSSRLWPSSGVNIHKKLAAVVESALAEIWQYVAGMVRAEGTAPADIAAFRQAVNDRIHRLRLNQHCGGFAFRRQRGSAELLSLHSFGIAIDWDPLNNPRGLPLRCTLPEWWYEIWAAHGFSDGRHFTTPDPMHVQFAKGI